MKMMLVEIITVMENYQPEYIKNLDRRDSYTLYAKVTQDELNALMSDFDGIEQVEILKTDESNHD